MEITKTKGIFEKSEHDIGEYGHWATFDHKIDGFITRTVMLSTKDFRLLGDPSILTVTIEPGDRMQNDHPSSNLVAHARRELKLIGEEASTIEGYLKVIQAFADMGHSGGSASVTIPTINALLQFKNLKPLTDDPEEWTHHGEDIWGEAGGIWQSNRRSDAFSKDGGKTYYLLDDDRTGTANKIIYSSVPKES